MALATNHCYYSSSLPVDKLLSNEDGGGIFDEPPTVNEPVPLPAGPDDDDDYDAFSRKFLFPQIIFSTSRLWIVLQSPHFNNADRVSDLLPISVEFYMVAVI